MTSEHGRISARRDESAARTAASLRKQASSKAKGGALPALAFIPHVQSCAPCWAQSSCKLA
eukprot:4532098-Pleurochrysis_carterae.AAC.3